MEDVTMIEAKRVRAALHFLRVKFGTWDLLGKAIHLTGTTLKQVATGHKPVSPLLTFRVARFAKVGIDDLLAGKWPDSCPYCHHRLSDNEGATNGVPVGAVQA